MVEPPIIIEALALELGEETVVADTIADNRCIFLAGLYAVFAERLNEHGDRQAIG